MQFPVFTLPSGARLREIDPARDAVPFLAYIRNPAMRQFIAKEDMPDTEEGAQEELAYWQSLFHYRRSLYWAVEDSAKQKIIGTAGFNHWSQQQSRAEISYDLDPNYWGKGIMTEALRAILTCAWKEMGLRRVQGTVALHNHASRRVLEKLGFVQEGMLHQYGMIDNKVHDFFMMACINPERK